MLMLCVASSFRKGVCGCVRKIEREKREKQKLGGDEKFELLLVWFLMMLGPVWVTGRLRQGRVCGP